MSRFSNTDNKHLDLSPGPSFSTPESPGSPLPGSSSANDYEPEGLILYVQFKCVKIADCVEGIKYKNLKFKIRIQWFRDTI